MGFGTFCSYACNDRFPIAWDERDNTIPSAMKRLFSMRPKQRTSDHGIEKQPWRDVLSLLGIISKAYSSQPKMWVEPWVNECYSNISSVAGWLWTAYWMSTLHDMPPISAAGISTHQMRNNVLLRRRHINADPYSALLESLHGISYMWHEAWTFYELLWNQKKFCCEPQIQVVCHMRMLVELVSRKYLLLQLYSFDLFHWKYHMNTRIQIACWFSPRLKRSIRTDGRVKQIYRSIGLNVDIQMRVCWPIDPCDTRMRLSPMHAHTCTWLITLFLFDHLWEIDPRLLGHRASMSVKVTGFGWPIDHLVI